MSKTLSPPVTLTPELVAGALVASDLGWGYTEFQRCFWKEIWQASRRPKQDLGRLADRLDVILKTGIVPDASTDLSTAGA